MKIYSSKVNRPAFTIVEVLVATTIIGIIAASAGLSFLKTRLNARNSQRKEVAQTYTKAVGAYSASTGTSFITASAQKDSCTVPPLIANQPPGHAFDSPSVPACVGADGRGFGMLNLDGSTGSITTSESNLSDDLIKLLGFSRGTGNFIYGDGGSILSALKALGYLDSVSIDPSVHPHNGKITVSDQDYLLVRCCKDGRQAVGTGGSLFAVWAKLEPNGSANVTDADANSQHACGGPKVAPPTYGSPDNSVATGTSSLYYHYIFGANGPVTSVSNNTKDNYEPSWFAVSNAPVQNLTSLSDSCDKKA